MKSFDLCWISNQIYVLLPCFGDKVCGSNATQHGLWKIIPFLLETGQTSWNEMPSVYDWGLLPFSEMRKVLSLISVCRYATIIFNDEFHSFDFKYKSWRKEVEKDTTYDCYLWLFGTFPKTGSSTKDILYEVIVAQCRGKL